MPYELIIYQRNQDNPLAPDALKAIHPSGKSPVLEDNGEIIVESGAIVEYWVKRDASQFASAEDREDDMAYLQWICCAESAAMTPMLFSRTLKPTMASYSVLFRIMIAAGGHIIHFRDGLAMNFPYSSALSFPYANQRRLYVCRKGDRGKPITPRFHEMDSDKILSLLRNTLLLRQSIIILTNSMSPPYTEWYIHSNAYLWQYFQSTCFTEIS